MLLDSGDDGVLPGPAEGGEELPAEAGQAAGRLLLHALIRCFVQSKSTDVKKFVLLSCVKKVKDFDVWCGKVWKSGLKARH